MSEESKPCACVYKDGKSEHNWHEKGCPAVKYARRWLDDETWASNLVCPYCGDVTDEETAWECLPKKGFEHDGDRTWVKCDECGREFKVTLSVSYDFKTEPVYTPKEAK